MKSFLEEGKQTEFTQIVEDVTDGLHGDGIEYIYNCLLWIHQNITEKLPENITKDDVFRKRTATQIIEDKYASGCTDFALVFVTLCRVTGIPTKYVEVIGKDWLEDPESKRMHGHVFAECLIDDKWIQIDPQLARIILRTTYHGFQIYHEGLDSWDLGIHGMEDIRKVFQEERRNYQENSITSK